LVGGWRAGLLFVVLSAALGLLVQRLVARVEQLVERLAGLARTDDLTGLPNRRAWRELLERELSAARRSGEPLVVALLDLDRFKEYNDAHGHLAGDRVLLGGAAEWRASLRDRDVLSRWGGDEFALVLPGCDAEHGAALIERMRSVSSDLEFSVGLVEWDGISPADAVLASADDLLYDAKHGVSAR
jgi:diguanylate cyclase (GGDEF)-like protein